MITMKDKGIEADGKTGESPGMEPKTVEIEVNSRKVEMPDRPVPGLEIKEEAIRQGVGVKSNFVLQQEMPNGTAKVIGDNDTVLVREHLSFTAIEPDDNS